MTQVAQMGRTSPENQSKANDAGRSVLQGENGAGRTYQQRLESSGCCELQDARQAAAPGRGTRRGHTSHTSETTRRAGHYEGPSKDPHTPPPNPSHAGAAPNAETAVVLATEPGGHTPLGEARRARHAQGDPTGSHCIHPRKSRQVVGEVVTQRAHSRERNRPLASKANDPG